MRKDNFHTRDLFIETLVKLGGEYLIRSEVSTEYDIKFKYSECNFMANVTNDSNDVVIWYPNWYSIDLGDDETCEYVKNLVNDLNYVCKSKFFYTTHKDDNLLRLHSSISFQLLPNIPNIEEYVSGKLNQIISDQQWLIQKMESLIEQVLLSVEHDYEDAS
ncbi:hypothetical protein [Prevotella sp. P6B1]|uniref:hypothetical protein n=1 Tax=Prevotella sp. P6B1 TaxID=1410613 RepID=UPI00051C2932|nr:hypothetical protein [Prevotella sp. P6B1]